MADLQTILSSGLIEETTLKTTAAKAYKAGQISYDPATGSFLLDTLYANIRLHAGRMNHIEVYNDTANDIPAGTNVSTLLTATDDLPNITPTKSSEILLVLGYGGITTMIIPKQTKGIIINYGPLYNQNTLGYSVGFIYADDNGGFTQTRPIYPYNRLIVGMVTKIGETDGIIFVLPQFIPRAIASNVSTFTSALAAAGTHYRSGFYDWATTSVTLNQGSLTQTYGDVNLTKAAHVGIVSAAAGTCDAGQVGIQVTGTLDSELGPQTAAQTVTITDDITTLTANQMIECTGKFSGQVTISLYVVSGSPTAYSVTFNYGFSKYEDFANTNVTIIGFNATWEAGATDTAFNIRVKPHLTTGWTYAATGFVAGNGNICDRLVDQGINSNLAIGKSGAYKRINLNQYIKGNENEGIIIEITTGSTNTIRSMDMQVIAVSEELN
jgi:hypothetical protein